MSRYANVMGVLFGGLVKSAREARGWTQAELARRMGERLEADVRPLTVTRIETAQRPVPLEEITVLAELLSLSVDALTARHPVEPPAVQGYLVTFANRAVGDMLLEDPSLLVEIRDGCIVIGDASGVVLAVPTGQVAAVQRVDRPLDGNTNNDTASQGPAPQE